MRGNRTSQGRKSTQVFRGMCEREGRRRSSQKKKKKKKKAKTWEFPTRTFMRVGPRKVVQDVRGRGGVGDQFALKEWKRDKEAKYGNMMTKCNKRGQRDRFFESGG